MKEEKKKKSTLTELATHCWKMVDGGERTQAQRPRQK